MRLQIQTEIDKTVKATITFSNNVKKNYDLPTKADYYGTIVGKTLTSANIKMEKTSYDYTGKAIVPEYKVYDGDKLLKEGTDYRSKEHNWWQRGWRSNISNRW